MKLNDLRRKHKVPLFLQRRPSPSGVVLPPKGSRDLHLQGRLTAVMDMHSALRYTEGVTREVILKLLDSMEVSIKLEMSNG